VAVAGSARFDQLPQPIIDQPLLLSGRHEQRFDLPRPVSSQSDAP
jgi:hypothetical protein